MEETPVKEQIGSTECGAELPNKVRKLSQIFGDEVAQLVEKANLSSKHQQRCLQEQISALENKLQENQTNSKKEIERIMQTNMSVKQSEEDIRREYDMTLERLSKEKIANDELRLNLQLSNIKQDAIMLDLQTKERELESKSTQCDVLSKELSKFMERLATLMNNKDTEKSSITADKSEPLAPTNSVEISSELKIPNDHGIYEALVTEYENMKSQISIQHSCKPQSKANLHVADNFDNASAEVALQLLQKKTEEVTKLEVEIERLNRELQESRTRELLAKAPEDLQKICEKNEKTLVNEMDLLQQDIVQHEEEIKKLNISLQFVQSESNDETCKLHRQLKQKEGSIIILKQQKELLQKRVNTAKKTIKLLKEESTVFTNVFNEPSPQLKQLIEKDVQLEQNYKKTQQDLDDHERCHNGTTTFAEMKIFENMQKKMNELEQKLKSSEQSHVKEILQLKTSSENHASGEEEYKVKYESVSSDLSKEKASNRTLTDNLSIANNNITALSYEKQKLSGRLSELTVENDMVGMELSDCKSRLSKLLSDRLTDNNPQIADVSDPNRPTKLAERHSVLYDNQWTDAFEVLQESFDEEKSIQKLLFCLMKIQEFCKEKAAEQVNHLQQVAFMRSAEEEQHSDTVDLKALIKEIRKQTAESSAQQVLKGFISKYPRYSSNPIILKYVEECVKLCWLMNAQDPPVVFAKAKAENTQLNYDLYKPYTQSGETMKFLVWPALLLHEEGSVLAKGVAQGFKAHEILEPRDSAEVDSKPHQSDPQINTSQQDTDTKSQDFDCSDKVEFQDARVKKDASVTNTYSQVEQKPTSPGSPNTNAVLTMNQRNMSTPQSPSSGSAVLHTRKAESTLDTQAGTTHPSAANYSRKLGASLRTSQHTATTQDRQNWSEPVGGIYRYLTQLQYPLTKK